MLNIEVDLWTLSKWLNEEQLCEIDRPALARVLGFVKSNIENYPQKDNWVGLSDIEKSNLWLESRAAIPRFYTYASLVEAELRKKNERK